MCRQCTSWLCVASYLLVALSAGPSVLCQAILPVKFAVTVSLVLRQSKLPSPRANPVLPFELVKQDLLLMHNLAVTCMPWLDVMLTSVATHRPACLQL